MLIQSLIGKGGESVPVGRIVALVGPNNAGKSTALREIFRLLLGRDPEDPSVELEDGIPTRVIDDLGLVSHLAADQLLRGLVGIKAGSEETCFRGLGPVLNAPHEVLVHSEVWSILHRPSLLARTLSRSRLASLLCLRTAYSDAATRPSLTRSVAACSPAATPENLLQALHRAAPEVHQQLDDGFREVLSDGHLLLDATERVHLTLRLAREIPPPSDDPMEAVHTHRQLPSVDAQGDGYRSVAAVMLTVLLSPGRVLILDEPAAHLNPVEATRLGEWIARQPARLGCQVVLATSNEAFLSGLVRGEDVTVVRLKRSSNRTDLEPVSSEATRALMKSPFLSGREVLDCLMRRRVVVTQSDEDRAVYELVARRSYGAFDVGFVHAHGQQNLSVVLRTLRKAELPACVIADMNVLDSRARFSELVTAVCGSPPRPSWLMTRDKLEHSLTQRMGRRALAVNTREIESLLDRFARGEDVPGSLQGEPEREGQSLANPAEHWQRLQQLGIDAVDDDLRPWVEQLMDELHGVGLFLVPKGQLQGWIDFGGPQSREDWFFNAVSDLELGECPADLDVFVGQVVHHLTAVRRPSS